MNGTGIDECDRKTQHMYHQFLMGISSRRRYQRMCFQKAHVAKKVSFIVFQFKIGNPAPLTKFAGAGPAHVEL